jgi:hypothetical protein
VTWCTYMCPLSTAKVAHMPMSSISYSGLVHIHVPTLDSQGGPCLPSVKFPCVSTQSPILNSCSQHVPSWTSPHSIKNPLPSCLVCPTARHTQLHPLLTAVASMGPPPHPLMALTDPCLHIWSIPLAVAMPWAWAHTHLGRVAMLHFICAHPLSHSLVHWGRDEVWP